MDDGVFSVTTEPPVKEPPATEPSALDVYSQQAALESENSENLAQDISAKAKHYVAKKKEAIDAGVHAIFADRIGTYNAIKSFKNRSQLACPLFPQEPAATALDAGSFFGTGDGRMAACSLHLNFVTKAAASYSFSPETLRCGTCPLNPHHPVMVKDETSLAPRRTCYLLCDQSGPPCLPNSVESALCVPVLRLEGDYSKIWRRTFSASQRAATSLLVACA